MSVRFQVLEGSIAAENPFPQLPGKFHGQDASIPVTDSLLSMGLLFLGSAGSGKTNTMLSLASQVLSSLKEDDIAVFFDMKGDYRDIFYADGDISLSATNDYFVWNLFDELIPFLEDEYLLNAERGNISVTQQVSQYFCHVIPPRIILFENYFHVLVCTHTCPSLSVYPADKAAFALPPDDCKVT